MNFSCTDVFFYFTENARKQAEQEARDQAKKEAAEGKNV